MKKIFTLSLIALLFLGVTNLRSQMLIDFETWTLEDDTLNFTTPEPLDFWGNPNITAEGLIYQGAPGIAAQCEPTSDAKNGFQAAKLTSTFYDFGAYTANIRGWLHTGSIVLGGPPTYAPIADIRVENNDKWGIFSGWYKYAPAEGDSCVFLAELYAADSTVLATAYLLAPAAAEYTEFSIPFEYTDEATDVTHMGVYICASKGLPQLGPFGAVGGSVLYIDDLGFAFPAATNQTIDNKTSIQVYPINMGNSLIVKDAENSILEIFSISGQQLHIQSINSSQEELSISKLSKGLYLYRITDKNLLISAGKFVK